MTLEQDPAANDPSAELVARARGDREAFGQLYDAMYPAIFRYCMRRLFVRAAAEDVTSEVFLRVASKMSEFRGEGIEDFRRWVFRIATNEINAYLRQSKRRRALLESAARSGMLSAAVESPTRPSEVELLDWPLLYRAILGLSPRDQAVVVLRFFERMSHDEIGAVLDERPATVRVVLSRAIDKLRRHFKVDDDRLVAPGS